MPILGLKGYKTVAILKNGDHSEIQVSKGKYAIRGLTLALNCADIVEAEYC